MSGEIVEIIQSTPELEKKEKQACNTEIVEQKYAEAFMDGFKYAIQILQDAIISKDKAE